jgi:hypothetical protein
MPDMAFPSGCWSHFYDLKTDTPRKVNKSLKEVVSARRAIAMVDIALMDKREGLARPAATSTNWMAPRYSLVVAAF